MCNFHDLYYAEDYAAFTCWFIKYPFLQAINILKGYISFAKDGRSICVTKNNQNYFFLLMFALWKKLNMTNSDKLK